MNSKIFISNTTEKLSEHFAQLLVNGVNERKEFFHIALSGGSTPKAVFQYLSENYKTKIEWDKIKFFWGDERCVPPNHPDSNYKLANDNLLSLVNIPSKNIFRIHGENDPVNEVINYSNILTNNIPLQSNYPQFDMVLLGLGEDGHTASIFPNHLNWFNTQKICAIAEHTVTNQKRITITGRIINNARQVVFLVTGKSKCKVVDIILNKKNGFEILPASHVNPGNGELIWLLDKNASSLLKDKS